MVRQHPGEGAPDLLRDLDSVVRVTESSLIIALEMRQGGVERVRLREDLELFMRARELDWSSSRPIAMSRRPRNITNHM